MLFAGGAKVGKQSGCNDIFEGVERRTLCGVVKCHLAAIHVHNYSNDLWLLGHVQ